MVDVGASVIVVEIVIVVVSTVVVLVTWQRCEDEQPTKGSKVVVQNTYRRGTWTAVIARAERCDDFCRGKGQR